MSAFARFSGSCVVCLGGTDTGLAFVGSPEWRAAGLNALGVLEDEAIAMIERDFMDDAPLHVRVCADCVRRSHLSFAKPAFLIPGAEIPALYEPVGAL